MSSREPRMVKAIENSVQGQRALRKARGRAVTPMTVPEREQRENLREKLAPVTTFCYILEVHAKLRPQLVSILVLV